MDRTEFLDRLRDLVGAQAVMSPNDLAGRDPGWDAGNLGAAALVRPATTADVARLVAWCREAKIALVPHGGRTGLVGGAVTGPAEIICDLGALNRIEEIDPLARVAVVQAGVTLNALQEAARAHGLEPGIDLAARGSATIGGMISTNAGGIMAFRNGVMRHRVLGLEVVLPDAQVFSDLTRVVKTSAGYDLKHLFIGAEGTLGIVTRAVIKLDPLTGTGATALVGLNDAASAQRVIRHFLAQGGTSLCAAEIMWRTYALTTSRVLGFTPGQLPLEAPCLLALELTADTFEQASGALESGLAAVWDEAEIIDGLVASSMQQAERIWRVREDTDILYRLHPRAPSFDVSVPAGAIDNYVARIQADLKAIDPGFEPYIFGHLADGNLHIVFNVEGPLPAATTEAVERVLYTGLNAIGGSFSAEHGVGSKKRAAFERYADPVKRQLARAVKTIIDPQGLFNPGKIVDPAA
jgi:FAD/FMN-containing dehydrogenase